MSGNEKGISQSQYDLAMKAVVEKVRAEYETTLAKQAQEIVELRAAKLNYVVSEVHKDIWKGTYGERPNTLDLSQVQGPVLPAQSREAILEGALVLAQNEA